MPAMLDGTDVRGGADYALGKQEPGCKRLIVAGRPHDDGERLAMETNVERLLGGSEIGAAFAALPSDPQHLDGPHRTEIIRHRHVTGEYPAFSRPPRRWRRSLPARASHRGG